MSIRLACDITMDLEGSIRPAFFLANELVTRGFKVSLVSPIMSRDVEEQLQACGITPINLRTNLITKSIDPSLFWFEAWAREAFFKYYSKNLDKEHQLTINFSQMISIPSRVCYLQGPPSTALRDMERELPTSLRIAYNVLRPIIEYVDKKLIYGMINGSTMIISNSKFCASMYSKYGIKVDEVIYPPIECKIFHPSTSDPSSDYVLTYFGKETIFSVIENIADRGVKVRAFGSKNPFFRSHKKGHPNIEFYGRVSTRELVDLYSNALYTLFPFSHEPFGYVPLESMACGTPVLTNDIQGPSEYVIRDNTGWLAHTNRDMEKKALELWCNGYPMKMRPDCIKAASQFDKRFYLKKWLMALEGIQNNALRR